LFIGGKSKLRQLTGTLDKTRFNKSIIETLLVFLRAKEGFNFSEDVFELFFGFWFFGYTTMGILGGG
jgi:hypothetical protein